MHMLDSHVGDLAKTLPGATRVFRQYGIDFCCGGGKPLRDACAKQGVDAEVVARDLASLAQEKDPVTEVGRLTPPELIDVILERYHAKHRVDLPELIALAARVERVHAEKPACPTGLADALREILLELELHMQKEEKVLFPMIVRGQGLAASGPIHVMELEHDAHGERLRRLEALTNDFELPEDACNTWRACYRGVRRFIDEVMEHIHLENNVLFPAVLGTRPAPQA